MRQFATLQAALATCGLLLAVGVQAQNMTSAEHKAGKDRISADYKTAKAACDSMSGNAKDICVEEAKGKEKVAKAELEHTRSGKAEDMRKVEMAKADATYEVAKERCDDKTGNDKDVCVKEAKAAKAKSEADIKGSRSAMNDKTDADYKVATEKCDAMSGDAKSSCVSAAKARFGKS